MLARISMTFLAFAVLQCCGGGSDVYFLLETGRKSDRQREARLGEEDDEMDGSKSGRFKLIAVMSSTKRKPVSFLQRLSSVVWQSILDDRIAFSLSRGFLR